MAREIITRIWCDVCLEDEQQVDATETPPIIMGSNKPRILALCETHEKEFLTPLRELLLAAGSLVDTGAPSVGRPPTRGRVVNEGPSYCLVRGCSAAGRPFKNEGSLGSHMRGVHSIQLTLYKKLLEEGGGEVVLPASPDEELPIPTGVEPETAECEHCDKKYTSDPARMNEPGMKYTTRVAQAIGVHRKMAHDVSGDSPAARNAKSRAKKVKDKVS